MARKILLTMLGVLVAVLSAELAVRSVAGLLPDPRPWPTPETEIKIAQIEDLEASGHDLDIVLIGSSVLESGVDPELLDRLSGIASYNAALPFSSPLSNEVWLRDFVLPRLSPTTVIIGLGVWPTVSTAQDDMLATGLNAIDPRDDDGFTFELLDRRRQLRNWSQTAESVRRMRSGAITPLGHQTVYYSVTRSEAGDPEFVGSRSANMNADNLAALVRTIEHLRSNSIEPVILIEPIGCPPIRESCPEFDLDAHPGRVLADEYDLQLIDAASQYWPDEMYADSAHLNRLGTELLTALVADQLDLAFTSSS